MEKEATIYENKENHHLFKRIKSNIDLAFNTSKSLLHLRFSHNPSKDFCHHLMFTNHGTTIATCYGNSCFLSVQALNKQHLHEQVVMEEL